MIPQVRKRSLEKDTSSQAGQNQTSLHFRQGQGQRQGKAPGRGAAWGSFPAGLLPAVAPLQLHSSARGCAPGGMQVHRGGRAWSLLSAGVSDPILREGFEGNMGPRGPRRRHGQQGVLTSQLWRLSLGSAHLGSDSSLTIYQLSDLRQMNHGSKPVSSLVSGDNYTVLMGER